MDDIKQMTGQANFNAPRALVLDELKLVGNSVGQVGGYFKYVGLTAEKGEDGKYPVAEIKDPLQVVFLIVRRRLIESDEEGLTRWTSEHDTVDDTVQLFDRDKNKERGIASALRQKYPNLRTEQVVYCRYKGKIIRLRVKGLSLRPTEKKDGYTSFYEYIRSFQGEGFHEYATKMTPVEVQTDRAKHWAINFERGEKLTDEQLEIVGHDIVSTYNHNKEIDAYYNKPVTPTEDEVDERLQAVAEEEYNDVVIEEDSQEMINKQSF